MDHSSASAHASGKPATTGDSTAPPGCAHKDEFPACGSRRRPPPAPSAASRLDTSSTAEAVPQRNRREKRLADYSDPSASLAGHKTPSFFSRAFMSWFFSFAIYGWKNEIDRGDLFPLDPSYDAQAVTDKFTQEWERAKGDNQAQSHGLGTVLRRIGLPLFAYSFLYDILSEACSQMMPLLIKIFLELTPDEINSSPDQHKTERLALCAAMLLTQGLHAVLLNRSAWITHANSLRTKVGLMGLIFNKTLSLTPEARHEFSLGRTVALMSTSVSRIDTAYPYLHYIWFGPLQLLVIIGLASFVLGWDIVRWIVLLILFAFPLQTLIMHRMNTLKKEIAHMTDRRLRFLQETIMGMRVVKCYAWESIFMERISKYRAEELCAIRRWRLFATLSIVLNVGLPAFSAVIGYLFLATERAKFTSDKVFTALIYFNMLDLPLSNMPIMTTLCVDAYAALKRIEVFLLAQSLPEPSQAGEDGSVSSKPDGSGSNSAVISFSNASFTWTPCADKDRVLSSGPQSPPRPLPLSLPTPVLQMVLQDETARPQPSPSPVSSNNDADESGSVSSLDQMIISPGQLVAAAPSTVFDTLAEQATWLPMQPGAIEFSAAHIAGDRIENESEDVDVSRGLDSISFAIPRGALVAIVGPVGSGKSSMLAAIYGEMECTAGKKSVGGLIAYCPQQAWIMNASIRDNILLGEPFDAKRYWQVIKECQMEDDLVALPYGDRTAIGEGGISLSGGQRARLNLARMLYFDREIYLMDDPLSAVDYRVSKALVEQCILGPVRAPVSGPASPDKKHAQTERRGLLAGKTRVLVTHHLGVLPHCDMIFVMNSGRIADKGTYSELLSRKGAFSDLLATYASEQRSTEATAGFMSGCESPSAAPASPIFSSSSGDETDTMSATQPVKRRYSSVKAPISVDKMTCTEEEAAKAVWRSEELQSKKLTYGIYGFYMAACGGIAFVLLMLAALTFNEILRTGRDIWLKMWVEVPVGDTPGFERFRNLYVVLAVLQTSATWVCGFVFIQGSYRASRILHDRAIARIMGSPIRFFETTPVGRIINRFGRDLDMIDVQVSDDVWYMLFAIGSMTSTLLLIVAYQPVASLLIVFPVAMALFLQAIYRAGARQVQRMYARYFSPLMANFSETYLGLSVAHAFGHLDFFRRRHNAATNAVSQCSVVSYALRRWTSMNCEFITAMLLSFSALACTVFNSTSERAGLILSSLVNFVFSLDWFIKQSAELEASMFAVERLHQYATELSVEEGADDGVGGKGAVAARVALDPSDDVELEKVSPAAGECLTVREHALPMAADAPELASWPSRGEIEFRNVYLCYRTGTRPVLSSISLHIRPGERVGIVGRTGAGKSSVMTALMRTVECSRGAICIDGVDIARVPLSVLRSRVTIVPQDPIMFAGTLAFNIDPRGAATDAELWQALEKVGMRDTVRRLRHKLQFEVSDLGENFSLGQRQLFCLARALLCRSRVVLMDEATASMDVETDAKIQRLLRDNFGGCTIVTIAHRLDTVRDYDRIVVLDAGRVAEVGSPRALLADPESRLSALFRSTLRAEDAE